MITVDTIVTVTRNSIHCLSFSHISTSQVGIKPGDKIKIERLQPYGHRKYAFFTFNGYSGFANVEDLTK